MSRSRLTPNRSQADLHRTVTPSRFPGTLRAGLAPIVLLVALCGCGGSVLLNSNLQNFSEGLIAGSNIPGAPEGDRVLNVIPEVFVTAGGTDLLDDNKLRVGGSVDYRPTGHSLPDRYQVTWRGVRDNQSSGATDIRLQDANGHSAVELRFQGNRLMVRSEDADQNPEPVFSPQRAHVVSIVLDMGTRRATVEVTEGDEVLVDTPALGLLDGDFSSLHTVQIDSQDDGDYFLQDLRVLAN